MASNMQSFPRMLKMLRENSNIKDKREALTYIRSNSKKLEATKTIKEEQYKELCKLVIDAFANGNSDIQNEAYGALNVIIRDFKEHSLNLFECMSRINQKNRLKILKLLEVVEDNAISVVAYDAHTVNFFKYCMCTIQENAMPWTAPTACVDNIEALTEAESRTLSDDQRLEEETINYCLTLLRRLYKVAAITSDIKVQRFNALLLDKIMVLAYMGHKRQRAPALNLLQQALATDIASHVRNKLPEEWAQYKTALQSVYCKRMLLLVSMCELDWATQWNVSIQFLGVDLHRGAGLINNLLSVEEKAFKSTDTIIRRQAFLSWKLLVDNFALDPQELATARRIKLLCTPLNAKNSKNELIALTKLEVWWHVIIKLYKDIRKFVNPVITQFLNFCFGPLGDTPLMSSKLDILASPGKRFFKTKVIAVDALCQLLVTKQENTVFSPILEERLPHSISDSVFQECYKSIIHSVGEALLVLSQLTDAEMKNRYQLGKILWTSLVNYIQETKMEKKELIYKDMILVITELTNYALDKPMIRNLILDTILFEVADLGRNFDFQDDTLFALVMKFLQTPLLNEAKHNHFEGLKSLLWQCIKSQKKNEYYPHAFKCLKEIYEKLHNLSSYHINFEAKYQIVTFELWRILVEVLIQYMDDLQDINEGSATEHNLKTVESIVSFPFMYIHLQDKEQEEELLIVWKRLYKQFEMRTDLMPTVKTNEILLNTTNAMLRCVERNKRCYHLIIHCLETLLSIVNYKFLLSNGEVPSIMHLILKIIPYTLYSNRVAECESVLKAFSAVLVTIYGHNPNKVTSYLQVCKPVIELILSTEQETGCKEIANTWEIIVTILKDLCKLINYDFALSFKKIIDLAVNHPNPDIQAQTTSLFETQNTSSNNAKVISEEKDASRRKTTNELDTAKKNEDGKPSNQVKTVGNFSNRQSTNQKGVFKGTDKSDKKISPDSDSQDYVFIKTDLKFDVSRLTEHQKESFKRRREDIPALYNDLSQSSSQDTQNLQEWFDKKNQALEETERTNAKKDGISMKNILNDDANKENKIAVDPEVITKAVVQNDTKLTESAGQNVSLEPIQNPKGCVDSNDNSCPENVKSSLDAATNDSLDSQEEFSTNKDNERLSPSILDNGKRRNRHSNVARPGALPESEEIINEPEQSNAVLQRTSKIPVVKHKSNTINKQKLSGNMENKPLDEEKRGVKRKASSDSESEGTIQRRRRKLMPSEAANDSDSPKFTESDNTAVQEDGIVKSGNVNRRIKKEISRLRINMVFDTPLTRSRRSKSHERRTSESNGVKRGRPPKVKLKSEVNNEFTKIKDIKITWGDKKNEGEEENNVQGERKEEENEVEVKPSNQDDVKPSNDDDVKPSNEDNVKPSNEDNVKPSNEPDTVVKDFIPCDCVHSVDNDSNENVKKAQDVKSVDQPQDDTQDIIENSQELQKKCNEKQCFIKINKIGDIRQTTKIQEITVEIENVSEIASSNCDNDNKEVPKDNQELEEVSEVNEPKIVSQAIDNSLCDNEEDDIFEIQKVSEGYSIKPVLGYMSPKSTINRHLKYKPYSTQGRAAHMLGLVTKQAKMETEYYSINFDEESIIKKTKTKDADETIGKKDRGPAFKEADKVTASCSSRQEKIFSNMKSSDYCLSPPMKLFSNLKNDGEKIFSKVDKSTDCESTETDDHVENVAEETLLETDELPILEWSSANPPSLTASPSVSILKRQRQTGPEPDAECVTPSKRKRVSFADPPVSKEMGYDVSTSDSSYKANKLVSRGLLGRKDTPLRMKPTKHRLIRYDSEKLGKEEADMHTSEIDLQCERENELLTKLAEEMEYSENMTMDTDIQGSNVIPPEDNCIRLNIDNISTTYEITQDTTFSKTTESNRNKADQEENDAALESKKESNVSIKCNELDESATQGCVFNGKDTSNVDDKLNGVCETLAENNTLDSLGFIIGNDSLRNQSSDKHSSSENLEDTVDAANLTSLNSTANSDEIFCGKLIRTSTQAASTEEQDTLLVTDSVFGSLPMSQDSQPSNEFDVEIPHPELLDSIQPIYPSLISCSEPIDRVIEQLTNPLWIQNLSTHLKNRKIQTMGDLAQLSEREVNRLPVKGNSKVEFVKSVLKCFEKTYFVKETSSAIEHLDVANNGTYSIDTNAPGSTSKLVPQDESLQTSSVTTQTEAENQAALLVRPNCSKIVDSDASETSKNAMECTLDECESNLAISSVSNSSNLTTTQAINESEAVAESPSCSNRNGISTIPLIVKTVGTCTSEDFICLPRMTAKATKSVSAQMALEDLLDEIDVNLVLESAARRCGPEKLLMQYKNKMKHLSQVEIERDAIRMLGAEPVKINTEVTLKAACRACGVNKVLLRLPDIFSADKQFFVKVLNAYRKKIKTSDCLNILDLAEVKDVVCQKCTSSELAEMLSRKLKEEEKEGIRKPMAELSSLDAMLKRMPMDVIISHTVANDELIPSCVVLDIALQNNSSTDITKALESQTPPMTKNVFDKLWSSDLAVKHLEEFGKSKEELLSIFKVVSSKLGQQDLLQAFYESMNAKVMVNEENN
ncbi:telomere-associated protein RIF1-like [Hylaeus volcanicus]|uniref:telomere-associated protein RIF1-like n=1 Tax=Hylaeus volcanicus TaxID=313075 RepID=UPI0023B80004|nr:telomere-associated protein RIF1-like [Hylaeus volcanicus]XP_053989571.1 telomere-associated protein RIF1-like [Hylaeus volcanicus]